MRLLILGGTVFLSATIAQQALAAGDEVVCLARGASGSPPDGVRWARADRDAGVSAYAELSGEFDAVVDVSRSAPHARSALQALAGRAAHWIYVSSCSVYARNDEPGADETAELSRRTTARPTRQRTGRPRWRPSWRCSSGSGPGADRPLRADHRCR